MILAERLVGELMLVSVLVAGEGAQGLAAGLEAAGAAAEVLAPGATGQGFDLAILLAAPGSAGTAETRTLVGALSGASERLLLAPLPLGDAGGAGPALPDLPAWFELFAELGYQPVVEFDAGFVSPGAFLVDRAATAAESDLTAFADRLQMGSEAAGAQRAAVQEAERNVRSELLAARTVVDERDAALARVRAELARAQGELTAMADAVRAAGHALQEAEARNAGWDGLRGWVRLEVADAARDDASVLRRDLPGLNALRAPDLPPVVLPEPARRRRLWPLRARAATARHSLLDDAARLRASPLFDAAWYVAANAEDFAAGRLDPVFHYLLVGGPRARDPGPWFDAATYVQQNPAAAANPLLHAIQTGATETIPS